MTLSSILTTGQPLAPMISSTILHNIPATSTLLLKSSPILSRRVRSPQSSRAFWWSAREWASYLDSGLQKHLHRQHRILKHRYAQALRRNALWDRPPTHNQGRPTGWRLSSSWYRDPNKDDKETGCHRRREEDPFADVDEPSMQSEYQSRREIFKKSFIDFKNRIDADPYGALFGRKLQRLCWHPKRDGWPGSTWMSNGGIELLKGRTADRYTEVFKNRSNENATEDWDSGFWETVSKRSGGSNAPKDNTPTTPSSSEKESNPSKTESPDAPAVKQTETIPSLQSTATEEFEFDPISMRKVPKKPVASATTLPQSTPTLDGPIDIPVKTFKGYRSQFHGMQPPKKPEGSVDGEPPSRTPPVSGDETSANKFHHDMAFHAPIPRVINLDPPSPKSSRDWLSNEGFGSKPHQSSREESKSSPLPKFSVESSTTKTERMEKIEPSVDRIQATFNSSEGSSQAKLTAAGGQRAHTPSNDEAGSEEENLSHLRASDIRSLPKFARSSLSTVDLQQLNLQGSGKGRTEHQHENTAALCSKGQTLLDRIQQAESRLRKIGKSDIYLAFAFLDYARWQRVAVSSNAEATTSKSAKEKKLDAVLSKEVDAQKTAMVAAETRGSRKIVKDAKPMNFFQANNYAPGPITGFAKSVLEHEKRAQEIREAEKVKERALVREIRSIYEDEYGTLSSKHRQPTPVSEIMAPIMPKESKISIPPKEQNRDFVEEIRSIYEDSYGKLSPNHRQPRAEPVVAAPEPPQLAKAAEPIIKKEEIPTVPPTIARVPEEPHVTSPEVEAQIIKEIQDDTNAKKKEQVLVDLKETADLKQDLQATRTLLDEAKAQLKLAESIPAANKDQQLPPPQTLISNSPSPPSTYKILAYDSSALQVTMAETTSSILSHNESPLSPAEALSRLNNAAKFLPHFSALQSAGYEIVSGTGDLLIFKKVRDVLPDEPAGALPPTNIPPWEIELQETQSPLPSTAPPSSPARYGSCTKTIKRTEHVFSGQTVNTARSAPSGSGSSSSESGPKAKPKRSKLSFVFWGALWTGASATAYSVVRNFFREGNAEDREVEWLGGTRKQR